MLEVINKVYHIIISIHSKSTQVMDDRVPPGFLLQNGRPVADGFKRFTLAYYFFDAIWFD